MVSTDSPEEKFLLKEIQEICFSAIIKQLPKTQRVVSVLAETQGLATFEIGEVLEYLNSYKMKKIKFAQAEFIGAFGDLGTFIPIFISLVVINGLNAQTTLLSVGLCYIICGFYYKIPIPVQPLKALAAIAIAGGLSLSIISAGTILMGVILLFLAGSGLINPLVRILASPLFEEYNLGLDCY